LCLFEFHGASSFFGGAAARGRRRSQLGPEGDRGEERVQAVEMVDHPSRQRCLRPRSSQQQTQSGALPSRVVHGFGSRALQEPSPLAKTPRTHADWLFICHRFGAGRRRCSTALSCDAAKRSLSASLARPLLPAIDRTPPLGRDTDCLCVSRESVPPSAPTQSSRAAHTPLKKQKK
jgi:hypothetical protein